MDVKGQVGSLRASVESELRHLVEKFGATRCGHRVLVGLDGVVDRGGNDGGGGGGHDAPWDRAARYGPDFAIGLEERDHSSRGNGVEDRVGHVVGGQQGEGASEELRGTWVMAHDRVVLVSLACRPGASVFGCVLQCVYDVGVDGVYRFGVSGVLPGGGQWCVVVEEHAGQLRQHLRRFGQWWWALGQA